VDCQSESSTPEQTLVQIRRMWEGGPRREFAHRPSSNWGTPYQDGYAGQYIGDHCGRPRLNGVYSVRYLRGPSSAYVWLCAECRGA